jgi:hypothetical protein
VIAGTILVILQLSVNAKWLADESRKWTLQRAAAGGGSRAPG